MVVDARMQLFTAEQRKIDAEFQRKYWWERVQFLEDIRQQSVPSSEYLCSAGYGPICLRTQLDNLDADGLAEGHCSEGVGGVVKL